MAKAKVKEDTATSEASPKLQANASEASVEIEEAASNDISTVPAPSGPVKAEEVAELAVIPIGEENQEEGENEDDEKLEEVKDEGENDEINKKEVNDEGKNEEERKEEAKDEGKVVSTLSKKAKRRRVKKKAVLAVAETPAAAAATAANDNKEEMENEDVKDERKESNLRKRVRKRRGKKKAVLSAAAGTADVAAVIDVNEVGTSTAKKASNKEGTGLIFMCSAKTKNDCFQYKVFGLPASKKEMVEKVYKGMKLFLFDIDLKLMYGIYKAAGPGGYNIEPKAFKSNFPSQVRFNVLTDCLPLPEEKFKAAIKANYYGKNKFNCELSQEQVKNLCKLFYDANKPSKLKRDRKVRVAKDGARRTELVPSSINRDRKRRRLSGTVSHPVIDRGNHMFSRGHDMYERDIYVSPPARQAMPPLYASPPRPAPVPPPLPLPAYAYEVPRGVDYYRTDPLLEVRNHRIMDVEMRHRDPIEYHDTYSLYREPVPYREPLYASGLPVGYHVPPPHPPHPLYRY